MLITNPLSILNAVKMRNEAVIHLEISDELGYLVDAIVNEDKIGTFDKRPNDLSLEVEFGNLALFFMTRSWIQSQSISTKIRVCSEAKNACLKNRRSWIRIQLFYRDKAIINSPSLPNLESDIFAIILWSKTSGLEFHLEWVSMCSGVREFAASCYYYSNTCGDLMATETRLFYCLTSWHDF